MKVVYVGGVPAVGKTSVLEQAKAVNRHPNIGFVEGTVFLRETLMKTSGTSLSILEVERLGVAEKMPIVEKAWKYGLSLGFDIIVVDGCYVQKRDGKYHVMVPPEFSANINSFVLVEASPEVIFNRRMNDRIKKPNRIFEHAEIAIELRMEKGAAESMATKHGMQLVVIQNNDIEKSAQELLRIIDLQLNKTD